MSHAKDTANQRFYSMLLKERRKFSESIFKMDSFRAAEMIDKLSKRERQVMEMMCYGLTTEEIARRINRAYATVECTRTRIRVKLGARIGECGRIWFAYKMHESLLVGMETAIRRRNAMKESKTKEDKVLIEWIEVIWAAQDYSYYHWRKTKRAKKVVFVDLQGTLVSVLEGWFERVAPIKGYVTKRDVWDQIELWVIARLAAGLDACPILNPLYSSCNGDREEPTGNVSSL